MLGILLVLLPVGYYAYKKFLAPDSSVDPETESKKDEKETKEPVPAAGENKK